MTFSSTGTNSSRAEYFDSHSPLGRPGKLLVYGHEIIFEADDKSEQDAKVSFVAADLKNIKTVSNKLHVELHYPDDIARSRLLIIEDVSLKPALVKIFQARRVGKWFALSDSLMQLPFVVKLALVLLIVPACISYYLYAIDEIYHFVPRSYDVALGAKVQEQIESRYTVCEVPEVNAFFDDLLGRLQSKEDYFDYEIKVLHSPVVNAFALPGGKLYFFSGLLEKSESAEEVAGILAHEMGHADLRHGVRALIRTTGVAFVLSMFIGAGLDGFETAETAAEVLATVLYLSYSRGAEREADNHAIDRLRRADISLQGLINFFERAPFSSSSKQSDGTDEGDENSFAKALEWVSTHPSDSARVDYLSAAQAKEGSTEALMSSARWERIRSLCRPESGKKE